MIVRRGILRGWRGVRVGGLIKVGDKELVAAKCACGCCEVTDPKGVWVDIVNFEDGDRVQEGEAVIRKNGR
jgi:hypothetical protein